MRKSIVMSESQRRKKLALIQRGKCFKCGRFLKVPSTLDQEDGEKPRALYCSKCNEPNNLRNLHLHEAENEKKLKYHEHLTKIVR